MPFFYYYDPTYILVLIGAVLSLWASATVKSTYNKYSRIYSYSGLTGAQAAAQILRQAGIYDVRIEHVSGNLTDIMIQKPECFACPTVSMDLIP